MSEVNDVAQSDPPTRRPRPPATKEKAKRMRASELLGRISFALTAIELALHEEGAVDRKLVELARSTLMGKSD